MTKLSGEGKSEVKDTPTGGAPRYDDEIDLFDYVEVIVRRRWLIIWGILLFTAGSYAQFRVTPVQALYEAEANALVRQDRHVDPATGRVANSPIQTNVLKSYRVGQWVLDEKVPADDGNAAPETLRERLGTEMTARQLLQSLSEMSEFEYSEDVVAVTVTHEDSSIAAAVANGFIAALVRYYEEEGRKQIQLESEFIDRRVEEVGDELRVAEDSLYAFRRRHHQKLPTDPEDEHRLSRELSWLQQEVGARRSLYQNLLNGQEQARLRSQLPSPKLEFLNYASSEDAVPTKFGLRQRLGLGAGAGLVAFVFLAFILEFMERSRKTGRMDTVLAELRGDRVFGWLMPSPRQSQRGREDERGGKGQ